MSNINRLIQNANNGNIGDMYESFSELMAEKIIDNINARRINLSGTLLELSHSGTCDEVHPDMSHDEWAAEEDGHEGHAHGPDGKCKTCGESVQLGERTAPLPKSSKFAILFSYEGKDNKFVTKLTNLGGKVDRKKKEVRFDFDNAAARTKFRKKNAAILKNLTPSRQLKDPKKEMMVVDKKGTVIVIDKKDEKKYLMKGYELAESYLYESKMSEFHMHVKDGKTAQQIARIMKIDLKTVKILMKDMKESYLYEAGKAKIGKNLIVPADKRTKDIIQSGKAKILYTGVSSIHNNARFVVVQRPLGHKGELRSNQDKVLMATISDPKSGRIKMFSYHGTHVNLAGAKKFAKNNKLVSENPTESYLYEARTKTRTFEFPDNRKAKQFAKDISNSAVATGTVSGNRVIDVEVLKGSPSLAKSAIAKYLKQNRGKELKESVVSKLQESYTTKMPVDIDIDGITIHVTPDVSEDIISLHDELNEVNQNKMRDILQSDASSFVRLVKFAQERN